MPCASSSAMSVGHVAAGEDRRVHGRMQRHDAMAEQLAEAGEALDGRDRDPLVGERLAPCRRSRRARRRARELARERGDAGLVVDGEERAMDRHAAISSLTTSGRSRCSTACTRARSVSVVSPGSTATGSARITGPVSTPSSTQWTSQQSRATPAARTSSIGCAPGNSGSGARVRVHDAPAEDLEEARTQEMHVAGEHRELHAALEEPAGERLVALARGRRTQPPSKTAVGMPAAAARSSARTPGSIRRDRDDRQAGVDQRLEVRPLAADEHADHPRTTLPMTCSSPGSATTAQ